MSKDLLPAILKSVVKNARSRGLAVEITLADLERMWDANSGRCALSSIPFDFKRRGRKRRPFAPSVDRIDCAKGYSVENCRLVCVAVNYAMSDWGEGVIRQIAHGLLGRTGYASVGRLPGTYIRHRGARVRFEVFLQVVGRRRYLGSFDTEAQAHLHYLAAKDAVLRGGSLGPFLPKAHQHAQQGVSSQSSTPDKCLI